MSPVWMIQFIKVGASVSVARGRGASPGQDVSKRERMFLMRAVSFDRGGIATRIDGR